MAIAIAAYLKHLDGVSLIGIDLISIVGVIVSLGRYVGRGRKCTHSSIDSIIFA